MGFGCPLGVLWVSFGCPLGVLWVSFGCPLGVVVHCTHGGGSLACRTSLLPQSKKRGWRWVSSMLHRLANRSGFTNLLIQTFRHIRCPGIKFIWPVVCWRTFRSCVAKRSVARLREIGFACPARVNIAPFRPLWPTPWGTRGNATADKRSDRYGFRLDRDRNGAKCARDQ